MGAWIEINFALRMTQGSRVAPLVGAWIEIHSFCFGHLEQSSLLSWERGLKSKAMKKADEEEESLLSWERGLKSLIFSILAPQNRRSSRGSVD